MQKDSNNSAVFRGLTTEQNDCGTSVNSPASCRDKKLNANRKIRVVLFVLGRVRSSDGVRWFDDVIRPRRCTGVWVYKAALLCWAGRTPPAESGLWIWWSRRQGWRRFGRPLHTASRDTPKKQKENISIFKRTITMRLHYPTHWQQIKYWNTQVLNLNIYFNIDFLHCRSWIQATLFIQVRPNSQYPPFEGLPFLMDIAHKKNLSAIKLG